MTDPERQLHESHARALEAKERAEQALERMTRAMHGATARQECLEGEIERLHKLLIRLFTKDTD